jgi:malate dehydrogenase (oxaloacetate-decarboxylating)(NADP+)
MKRSSRKWLHSTRIPSSSVSPLHEVPTNPFVALSNPSAKAECTFENAVTRTDGSVLFASCSPFPETTHKGKTYTPGQGNNMYIFPGLGLGAILSEARKVTDAMIVIASESLASCITEDEFSMGFRYPHLSRIREVSLHIAREVVKMAQKEGVDVEYSRSVTPRLICNWPSL